MLESPALQAVGLEALASKEQARRVVVADDMEHDLLELAPGMGEGGAQQGPAEPGSAIARPHIEAPQDPLMRLAGARKAPKTVACSRVSKKWPSGSAESFSKVMAKASGLVASASSRIARHPRGA